MPDNHNKFNLFGDLSDSEIERFLLDSAETDLETLEMFDDEHPKRDKDLALYDDVLIHDDLVMEGEEDTNNAAKSRNNWFSGAHQQVLPTTNHNQLKNAHAPKKEPQQAQQQRQQKALYKGADHANITSDNDHIDSNRIDSNKIDADDIDGDIDNNDIDNNNAATPLATIEPVTPIINEFDRKIDTIEHTRQAFKAQLTAIAAMSDSFHDTSSQMMQAIRDLDNHGDDDFSITYEQVYQLRSCLLAARRAFNEVPNFYDLVEQAWEYDLYTAQTRRKQHNQDV